MRSSDLPNDDLTLNVQEIQDINELIHDYKTHLEEITRQTQSPLKDCLTDFLEKITNLLTSITTAGATLETVLKDLVSVINVLTQASTDHIVDLFERWNKHTNAYNIRKKAGIPSAVGGVGVSITAGVLFFTSTVVTVPILITAGVIGLGIGIFSGYVVVDANRKRTTIAECLHDILNCVFNSLLETKKYSEFTCAKLAIIKLIAQSNSNSDQRDITIDIVIGLIAKTNDIDEIITKLSELNSNLIGICWHSATASLVGDLMNTMKQVKENLNKSIPTDTTNTSFSL